MDLHMPKTPNAKNSRDLVYILQWNANMDLHMPCSSMSFQTSLSDLAKYSCKNGTHNPQKRCA